MKLYKYELYKLWGIRWLRYMVVAFFLINILLTLYHANQSGVSRAANTKIAEFYELYFQDPIGMDAYCDNLMKAEDGSISDPWSDMEDGAIIGGNKYAPDGYNDTQLFGMVYDSIYEADIYSTRMEKAVKQAEINLAELRIMGISNTSYNSRFQMAIIERYSFLMDNVRIGVEHVYGWNTYFSYDSVIVFIFLLIAVVVATVISCDSSADFDCVIHCTRLGKRGTIRAKIGVICTVTVMLVLLFSLASFGTIALKCGYSSPMNAMQSLKGYEFAQYAMTVGEYFTVATLVRILACLAFATLTAVVAVYLRNQLLICGFGILLGGGNLLLYLLPYGGAEPAFKYLNFMSIALGEPLFLRLRACNGFGFVWHYVPITFIACLFCAVVGLAWVCFFYPKQKVGKKWGAKIVSIVNEIKEKRTRLSFRKHLFHKKPITLIKAEVQKITMNRGLMLLIVAVTICKLIWSINEYRPIISYSDKILHTYMTELEGELTSEKLSFIEAEREDIETILFMDDEMRQAYIQGEITSTEYSAYLDKHEYASNKDGFLRMAENRRDYLLTLAESGREGWFLYDTGWKKLTCVGTDYFLYAFILMICAGIFAVEYKQDNPRDGFARILRTTKKGRFSTFIAKLGVIIEITVITTILYNLIDLIVVASYYSLPSPNAPLYSMEMFSSVDTNITIGRYFLALIVVRCFTAVCLSLIVAALSALTRKSFSALVTAVSITLLPAFLEKLDISLARYANYQTLLGGYSLLDVSAKTDWGGMDWILAITLLVGVALITVAVLLVAYRKYDKVEV